LAIAALLERHPGLHVATVESPYDALVAGLRNGDIDLIFGALRDDEQNKDLKQQRLFKDRISVIARAGHPLLQTDRIDFDTLRRSQWVLSRNGSPSRELLKLFFSEANELPPDPAVETGDLAILRGLLLESDMITAISAHQLHYEISDGSLAVVDFSLDRIQREIGLTQRLGAFPSPGILAFMEEIKNVISTSPGFSF
jgi:LysR family transcriptional regulator of gallate degradation